MFVDSQGNFQSQLGLTPGPKQIIVKSLNRFGKITSKTLNVTGEVPADSGRQAAALELKINFTAGVTLGFAIDGQAQQVLDFSSGDSKIFTAQQKILLSTTNAGATRVILNGQVLGPMGRDKEILNNVSFFAQSTTTPSSQ